MFRAADLEPGPLEPLKAGAGAGGTSPPKKTDQENLFKEHFFKNQVYLC